MKNGMTRSPRDSQEILLNLSEEITRPLELLQDGITRLLGGNEGTLSDAERTQAETLLVLCGEIDRLTRDYLVSPEQPRI